VLGRHLTFNDWMYYLCWGVAGIMFVLAWALSRSRAGRALRAVRDNEVASASFGVSLAAYKTFAFGVSAFYAGVAGALYAIHTTFVNPDVFPVTLSITLLVGLVVGGLGSTGALIAGAAFVVYLPKLAETLAERDDRLPDRLESLLGFDQPGTPSIVFGAVIILVMLLLPFGVGGLLRRFFGPLTNRLYTRSEP
jgi:branched-chain amino acid transport system permease protein